MPTESKRRLVTAVLIVSLSLVLLSTGWYLVQNNPPPLPRYPAPAPAEGPNNTDRTETVEARIVRVIGSDPAQSVQQLQVEIVSGPLSGQQAQVEHETASFTRDPVWFREGDQVLVAVVTHPEGGHDLIVTDYARNGALALLGALFIGVTILVSGQKGLRALIGLAITFIILWGVILPRLLAGTDPVPVSIVGAFVVLAVTLYLTQGWSLKTHAALLGILISLALIGLFSAVAVDMTRLNGAGMEEAVTLQASNTVLNLRGLLLAGMLIGALGVLYDMAISQSSAVMELAEADSTLRWRELYRRAMNIGHDHIAATINTLVLAYVGAALPMLLVFQLFPQPWLVMINREFIGEEIVRSLIGSLGLVAAVPITTLIASVLRQSQATRMPAPAER